MDSILEEEGVLEEAVVREDGVLEEEGVRDAARAWPEAWRELKDTHERVRLPHTINDPSMMEIRSLEQRLAREALSQDPIRAGHWECLFGVMPSLDPSPPVGPSTS